MVFDPENPVIMLCIKGMELDAAGDSGGALNAFMQAWEQASGDFEKFTAAHYIARHQPTISDKLIWDETALAHALNISDTNSRAVYPSLYLNVAKCHEDLGDLVKAKIFYDTALSYADALENDDYGKMIRAGIAEGIRRLG